MDNLTKKQRSLCMSRIRSKNTKPELFVRRILSGSGIKYKLYPGKLPGKPDILIPSKKSVIFINGCFWHQHKYCKRKAMPKTNRGYWVKKLHRNVAKQKQDLIDLKGRGFKTLIVWECQVKKPKALEKRIKSFIK